MSETQVLNARAQQAASQDKLIQALLIQEFVESCCPILSRTTQILPSNYVDHHLLALDLNRAASFDVRYLILLLKVGD